MLIKKRKIQTTNRLYIQDKELLETAFKPGQAYKYIIENNKVTIVPTDVKDANKVSKRKYKKEVKGVIDIRAKGALDAFKGANELELYIYEEKIVIIGYSKVVAFGKSKKSLVASIAVNKSDLQQAVGCEQLSLFNSLHIADIIKNKLNSDMKSVLNVISLFSGAGLMDLGFKEAGFNIKFALELEEDMCTTYKYNIGHHIVNADINYYNLDLIPDAEVVIGGSPCQGFSNANRNTSLIDSPKNKLVRRFIDVVKKTKSCLVFLLENVPQIISKEGGKFISEIRKELKDFNITINKLNASEFGSAQARERVFIVGCKTGAINIQKPCISAIRTVRDAFKGLTSNVANQKDCTVPKKGTIEKMKYIKPGENFEAIPKYLRPQSQHSNMYYRLKWDSASITIVNVRKAMILHPEKNRILSIRECARLFDLKDSYHFFGKLASKQQMLANGVPFKMINSIAKQIKVALNDTKHGGESYA